MNAETNLWLQREELYKPQTFVTSSLKLTSEYCALFTSDRWHFSFNIYSWRISIVIFVKKKNERRSESTTWQESPMHSARRNWIGVAGFQYGAPTAVGTWRRRASRPAASSLQRSYSVDWFEKIVSYQRSPSSLDSLEDHLIVDDND